MAHLDDVVGSVIACNLDRRALLRRALAVSLAVPTLSLLAACGTDDADNTEENPPSGAADATSDDSTTEPTESGDSDSEPTDTTGASAPTQASSGEGQPGGTVRVAVAASPTSMDLQYQSNWPTYQQVRHMYDTLLLNDDDDQLHPRLATAWEVSDDGLIYTLQLRDDVVFHDDTPFNAEALRFNYQRQLDDPDTRQHVYFTETIDTLTVVDDHTFEITLKKPDVFFGYRLAGWESAMASPTAVEALGEDFALQPVGTGPFKFVSYVPDSNLEFERNDNYWGGAPLLDGLSISIIPEPSVHTIEMQSDGIDASYAIDIQDLELMESEDKVVDTRVTPGASFVSLNVAKGLTAEFAVRRAIALAIDRETIIEQTLFGLAEKSRGGVPQASPYYREDVPEIPYDPEEAGRVLDEAGWVMGDGDIRERDGQPLRIRILSTEFGTYGLYNQILQEQLKQVGIDSEVQLFEWGAYLDKWRAEGDYEMTYHSQGGIQFADFVGGSIWPDDYWHIHHLRESTDPELMAVSERLLEIKDLFRNEPDVEKRSEIWAEGQQLIQDNQLTIWLWHAQSWAVIQPGVKDATFVARGYDFSKAWID